MIDYQQPSLNIKLTKNKTRMCVVIQWKPTNQYSFIKICHILRDYYIAITHLYLMILDGLFFLNFIHQQVNLWMQNCKMIKFIHFILCSFLLDSSSILLLFFSYIRRVSCRNKLFSWLLTHTHTWNYRPLVNKRRGKKLYWWNQNFCV